VVGFGFADSFIRSRHHTQVTQTVRKPLCWQGVAMPKYVHIERSDTAGNYIDEIKSLPQVLDGELDDIDYIEPGTQIILTIVEMSQEEFENLPEFEGW
jgi:hypothetical protein